MVGRDGGERWWGEMVGRGDVVQAIEGRACSSVSVREGEVGRKEERVCGEGVSRFGATAAECVYNV